MPMTIGSGGFTGTTPPRPDPKVFIDRGRHIPQGPPLLQERRCRREDAEEQLQKSLQTHAWKALKQPAWDAAADV